MGNKLLGQEQAGSLGQSKGPHKPPIFSLGAALPRSVTCREDAGAGMRLGDKGGKKRGLVASQGVRRRSLGSVWGSLLSSLPQPPAPGQISALHLPHY